MTKNTRDIRSVSQAAGLGGRIGHRDITVSQSHSNRSRRFWDASPWYHDKQTSTGRQNFAPKIRHSTDLRVYFTERRDRKCQEQNYWFSQTSTDNVCSKAAPQVEAGPAAPRNEVPLARADPKPTAALATPDTTLDLGGSSLETRDRGTATSPAKPDNDIDEWSCYSKYIANTHTQYRIYWLRHEIIV